MSKIQLSGTTRRIWISAENIDQFRMNPDNREIKEKQVLSMLQDLRERRSLEVQCVFMKMPTKKGKPEQWMVLDGHNRMEATKRYLKEVTKARVEVEFRQLPYNDDTYYKLKTHKKWSKITLHNFEDQIKQMLPVLPAINMILNGGDFPVEITNKTKRGALKLNKALTAYWRRCRPPENSTPSRVCDKIKYAETMTQKDYSNLRRYFLFHKGIFGFPAESPDTYSTNALEMLMKVYFNNLNDISSVEMCQRWEKFLTTPVDKKMFKENRKKENYVRARQFYEYLIARLNSGYKKKVFRKLPRPNE